MVRRIYSLLCRHGVYLAWLVSLTAVSGSLYFSEVVGFIPCHLCWFQRILMYPLAVLLGIASYRQDRNIFIYAVPLSAIGGCISLYHYAEQKLPWLAELAPCTVGVPCSGQYINWLGFITIPLLALSAFVLIVLFLWLARKESADHQ
jgi:disulfide bond formation protein DsbB